MAVSPKFIIHQAPTIAALAEVIGSALYNRATGAELPAPTIPGPEIETTLSPRPDDLVRTYIRNVGGDPSAYRGIVPPHIFPQWGFPLASKALVGLKYPFERIVNAGCRLEASAPLPQGEPLNVRVRLDDIDDNGRRALIRVRVITGTASAPDALTGYIQTFIPLGGPPSSDESAKKKEPPRVPSDGREIGVWKLAANAGLDFAKLTGDFNPIHWLAPYARAMGFRSCILHGFSTMARSFEGLARARLAGTPGRISVFESRFTHPLGLPATVGLYLGGDQTIFVGAAPGGRAFLEGRYELR